MTMNNARIKCFGGYIPIRDIEAIDTKQKIWKGKRIVEIGTPTDVLEELFFSRDYSSDSEIDKLLCEKHIKDNSILGCEFWLIPKEKLLFGYDPPSTILKPDIRPSSSRPRIQI